MSFHFLNSESREVQQLDLIRPVAWKYDDEGSGMKECPFNDVYHVPGTTITNAEHSTAASKSLPLLKNIRKENSKAPFVEHCSCFAREDDNEFQYPTHG
jgi:hypothetical protein